MIGIKRANLLALAVALFAVEANAAGGAKHAHAPEGGWSFEGVLGVFDIGQLQRGYKVYSEVCAACHSMKLLRFRHLGDAGAPFYDPQFPDPNDNPVVKALAAEHMVAAIDEETGDAIERTAMPSDGFVSPFANSFEARASNAGAFPPDLSVIAKARKGGASYLYSLLVGYPDEKKMRSDYAGLSVDSGQYYNPYFAGDTSSNWSGDPRHAPYGGMLAMSPPLFEDMVEYDDGTMASVEQMAMDVAAFLQWAAEPRQTDRKRLGLAVMLYLIILTVLSYASYRRIWRDMH